MEIPLFHPGYQGRSVNVSSIRRLNMVADFTEGGKSVAYYPTPGTITFADTLSGLPIRGMRVAQAFPTRLFAVSGGTLFEISNTGVVQNRGTLDINTGTGIVSLSDNGTQLMLVDGVKGYIFNMSTNTFSTISDADFPVCRTVTFQDQYFIVPQDQTGKFFISALLDGLTWDALDFATAEGSPDNILNVASHRGILVIFGGQSIEFWASSGDQVFPFTRIEAVNSTYGLAAQHSVAAVDDTIMFLGANQHGEVAPCLLGGSTVRQMADADVIRKIKSLGTFSDAIGFTYKNDGRTFYQLNFPTANKSWLCTVGKPPGLWSEISYGQSDRHIARLGVAFQNKVMVGSRIDGKIYEMGHAYTTDNGAAIFREAITRHVFASDLNLMSGHRIRLDSETGVGNQEGQEPYITLQVSKDNGHTYGNAMFRSLGKLGQYQHRTYWNRIGKGRDFVLKFATDSDAQWNTMAAYATLGVGEQ